MAGTPHYTGVGHRVGHSVQAHHLSVITIRVLCPPAHGHGHGAGLHWEQGEHLCQEHRPELFVLIEIF